MPSVISKEQLRDSMKKEKGVNIFGRFFSNRELFWNGVAFLFIGIAYDVLAIGNSLPADWKENIDSVSTVDSGWFFQTLLFVISYLLLDKRFFGADLQEIIKKNGYPKYFLLKFLLVFALIFVNLTLKAVALILFF